MHCIQWKYKFSFERISLFQFEIVAFLKFNKGQIHSDPDHANYATISNNIVAIFIFLYDLEAGCLDVFSVDHLMRYLTVNYSFGSFLKKC